VKALDNVEDVNEMIKELVKERKRLEAELPKLSVVEKVYPSDANFLLVKVVDARGIYEYLLANQIVVRDRSKVLLCEGSLRITVGTAKENDELLKALQNFIV
jgi:histidinol-phosphate aminotransferase